MNIIVDGDRVIEYMHIMLDALQEFKDELIVIQNMRNEIVWDSDAGKKVIDLYDKEINDIIIFGNKMITFVGFLNNFLKNYDDSLSEIKESFKKLNDDLNDLKIL